LRTTTVRPKGARPRETRDDELHVAEAREVEVPKPKANAAKIIGALVFYIGFRFATDTGIALTPEISLGDLVVAIAAGIALFFIIRAMRREGIETVRAREPLRLLALLLFALAFFSLGVGGTIYFFSDPLALTDSKRWPLMHQWS